MHLNTPIRSLLRIVLARNATGKQQLCIRLSFNLLRTIMFKLELYGKTNTVPRTDSLKVLNKFAPLMKWGTGCQVLDLGCGDGSVTVGVLERFLPKDYGLLVGADVGPEMVAHANETYGDRRTKFIVLDMTRDPPREFNAFFDHVFSSYAIHWVHEQEKTFSNIYTMLADGGNCLLLFIGYTRVYDFYRELARKPKWKFLLKDAEKYISPYQDTDEPEKHVHRIMANVGFERIDVQLEKKSYLYNEQDFRNTMLAICPFKIPPDYVQEFMDDYMQVARDLHIVKQVDRQTMVLIEYTLIIAKGTKCN